MSLKEERQIQIQLVYISKHIFKLPVIANINEQKCTVAWRVIKEKMGLIKGVSDLLYPRGNGVKSGLWLELKTCSGKPSKEQKEFLELMISLGYEGKIAYGFDQSLKIVCDFYGLNHIVM